jgi:hypothetical protein
MTLEQAYKIAQPYLKQGMVCVLSNKAEFICNDDSEVENVKSFAEREGLKFFFFESGKEVVNVVEETKEEVIEVIEPEVAKPKKTTKKKA